MTFTDLIKIHRDTNSRNRRQETKDRQYRAQTTRARAENGQLFTDWACI